MNTSAVQHVPEESRKRIITRYEDLGEDRNSRCFSSRFTINDGEIIISEVSSLFLPYGSICPYDFRLEQDLGILKINGISRRHTILTMSKILNKTINQEETAQK